MAYSTARNGAELHQGLASRTMIGEALGTLMERHGMGEDAAFAWLVEPSRKDNVKLRGTAHTIVTGQYRSP